MSWAKLLSGSLGILMLLVLLSCRRDDDVVAMTPAGDVSGSAIQLDEMSREKLGVGIAAVAMLFQSGPRTFLLKETLSDGELAGIRELVENDFATADEGVVAEGSVVRLKPTAKGLALLTAFNIEEGD